jgi:hypothetical protein
VESRNFLGCLSADNKFYEDANTFGPHLLLPLKTLATLTTHTTFSMFSSSSCLQFNSQESGGLRTN